jgi:hypothetical protein
MRLLELGCIRLLEVSLEATENLEALWEGDKPADLGTDLMWRKVLELWPELSFSASWKHMVCISLLQACS